VRNILLLCALSFFIACGKKESADFIIYNGKIYTVDSSFSTSEAMAVKDGKILAVGKYGDLQDKFVTQERINLEGKAVYPGFIDAHCHFLAYGLFLQKADLAGTKSFAEVVSRLDTWNKENSQKPWVLGRGWDQNDWTDQQFPDRAALDSVFKDKPVFIERIDGHAVLVNEAALKLAGVTEKTQISGGVIEKRNGRLTGILVDNAMELVRKVIPRPTLQEKITALKQAQSNCFEKGLTTIDDAGLDKADIDLIDSLQKSGDLQMRIYAMISDKKENLDHYLKTGPYKTERLNVRSVKFYADGALGSRGACMLQPYSDAPEQTGFLLNTVEYYERNALLLDSKGFQMNTHCIGDSANRAILDIYGKVLKGKNDKRWRIEHAQILNDSDVKKFGQFSVIPSVQPTHATSDMYWAGERLGKERIHCGYRYQELITQAGIIACGSDFPVEDINPLYGFYAAVSRKDRKGQPVNGFQAHNRISREQALCGMTSWAALSNFEEHEKGSLEPGKFADFVVLESDIMNSTEQDLHAVKVLYTYLAGKKVYQQSR
jgi:predicted amidohydrolase YtcJ